MPVLDIGLPEPAPPGSLVCTRWLSPGAFTVCTADDFDSPEIFEQVVDGATDLLFAASGRQYPGVCTDLVRPQRAGGCWFPGDRTFDASAYLAPVAGAVWLPGYPVVDIVAVTIEGVPLASTEWLIVDDRWLVRRGDDAGTVSWPSFRNRLDRPDGETDTWTVEYRFGASPPLAGLLALQVLVCELGLAWKGDACRLPKRLTQVTREGFSAVILDPFKFLDEGKFGVYEIDTFVNMANPHHVTSDAKVLNVDLLGSMPRRVR